MWRLDPRIVLGLLKNAGNISTELEIIIIHNLSQIPIKGTVSANNEQTLREHIFCPNRDFEDIHRPTENKNNSLALFC